MTTSVPAKLRIGLVYKGHSIDTAMVTEMLAEDFDLIARGDVPLQQRLNQLLANRVTGFDGHDFNKGEIIECIRLMSQIDRYALIIAIRVETHGPDLEFDAECGECSVKTPIKFDLTGPMRVPFKHEPPIAGTVFPTFVTTIHHRGGEYIAEWTSLFPSSERVLAWLGHKNLSTTDTAALGGMRMTFRAWSRLISLKTPTATTVMKRAFNVNEENVPVLTESDKAELKALKGLPMAVFETLDSEISAIELSYLSLDHDHVCRGCGAKDTSTIPLVGQEFFQPHRRKRSQTSTPDALPGTDGLLV